MKNEKWKMAYDKWEMKNENENERCKIKKLKWKMENDKKMKSGNEKWKNENGNEKRQCTCYGPALFSPPTKLRKAKRGKL